MKAVKTGKILVVTTKTIEIKSTTYQYHILGTNLKLKQIYLDLCDFLNIDK